MSFNNLAKKCALPWTWSVIFALTLCIPVPNSSYCGTLHIQHNWVKLLAITGSGSQGLLWYCVKRTQLCCLLAFFYWSSLQIQIRKKRWHQGQTKVHWCVAHRKLEKLGKFLRYFLALSGSNLIHLRRVTSPWILFWFGLSVFMRISRLGGTSCLLCLQLFTARMILLFTVRTIFLLWATPTCSLLQFPPPTHTSIHVNFAME